MTGIQIFLVLLPLIIHTIISGYMTYRVVKTNIFTKKAKIPEYHACHSHSIHLVGFGIPHS